MKPKFAPITLIANATKESTAQVTLNVRKGTAKADIKIHSREKAFSKDATFALLDGVLYSHVTQKHLQDFVVHLENNDTISKLMNTPLAMGFMPKLVHEKVRECIVSVLTKNKVFTIKLDQEILAVAALLACLRELWEPEYPEHGNELLRHETHGVLGDLHDRKPKLAQAIKNLLGWGNEDEQSEDQVKWLRKVVKKQLQETTHVLRLMRDNPLGGSSVGALAPTPSSTPSSSSPAAL